MKSMRDGSDRDPEEAKREALTGDALARKGDLVSACAHYDRAIRLQPENAQYHFQLGALEWGLGREEAGEHFERAVELRPDFAVALAALSAWCLQYGQATKAEQASAQAMELAPDDSTVMQSRAAALEVIGELDQAWELIEKLVKRGFVSMPVIRLYGRMSRYRGQQEKALGVISGELAKGRWRGMDLSRLHLTAADLLDSLGRFDEAFEQARLGNAAAPVQYDAQAHEQTFDSFIAYFTRQKIQSLAGASSRNEKPVFIVGMPRSGTSLVEQILAAHRQIHGAGELNTMANVWEKTVRILGGTSEDDPACLDRLTSAQADALGRAYLEPLTALNPAASRITDKMPLNFLHLGLIGRLLPGARVIDCRRDPRDTCLSCYMAFFEGGNDFKYSLGSASHFYRQYRRLMDHWKSVLDLPILEVCYETLVGNMEAETRRLLTFLDLEWDERCLRFYENKRPVSTSSRQQVRQPLYASSIGRWKNYRRHLSELDPWLGQVRL